MSSFLNKVVELILGEQNIATEEWTVVLPNRRAVRFIQQIIAKQITAPIFSPTFLTINDFMEQHSELSLLPEEELLCYLYQSYCEVMKGDAHDFKYFLSWAPIFLSDCNEIDRQLANGEAIFSNIHNIKELELVFLNEDGANAKDKYLQFYASLQKIRQHFIEKLRALKMGYEGMIYRDAAERINEREITNNHHYLFAGFLALSPAELEVLAYYKQAQNGRFLFDVDELYKDNHARFFLDQIEKKLKLGAIATSHHFESEKAITVTGIAGNTAQIYHAISLIQEIEKEQGHLENTALILADESLIVPFVHAYPIAKCNISMGYPIKHTSAYQLLYTILQSYKNGERFRQMQGKTEPLFYHKDVIALLHSSLIDGFIVKNKEENGTEITINDPVEQFIALNQIFVTKEQLPFQTEIKEILTVTAHGFLEKIIKLFDLVLSNLDKYHIDYFAVQNVWSALQNVAQLYKKYEGTIPTSDFQVMEFFIQKELGRIQIAFKGDFNQGLQIMGVLESRIIDFENVIVLSCNDAILPKNTNENSMILYDVKRYFQLPNSQYKESVFAYHFFRLIQRAENVHLIHNTDSSSSLMEKSRFIHQLRFEIEKRGLMKNIDWKENELHILPSLQSNEKIIEIKKTDAIIQKLKKFTFSASSLARYVNCPLSFYLNNIEKIKPYETVNEAMESNMLGTVIHEALKELLIDIKRHGNPTFHIDEYEANLEEKVKNIIKMQPGLEKANINEGKLYLAVNVIYKYLKRYLKLLKSYLRNPQISIYSVEGQHTCKVTVHGNELELKGYIDRIDVVGNTTFIFDYKTGKVDEKEINICAADIDSEVRDLFQNPEKSKLLQLLFYAFLIKNEQIISKNEIMCGLISFQRIFSSDDDYTVYATFEEKTRGTKWYTLERVVPDQVLKAFSENVVELLEEILDVATPFKATDDVKRCKFCDYAEVCGRFITSEW